MIRVKKYRFRKILAVELLAFSCSLAYSDWQLNNACTQTTPPPVENIPVCYIGSGTTRRYFTSIESGLNAAVSGDIVITIPGEKANYHVANNPYIPDKVTYTISEDCEIKAGVTLLISTDNDTVSSVVDSSSLSTYITSMQKDDRTRGESNGDSDRKESYGSYATSNSSNYLRSTIEISKNVTLTNNGTLVISGYLSSGASASSGMVGQTSHSYARFLLDEKAKIIQKDSSAITYCFGYIEEKATSNGSYVDFSYGRAYLPLIVKDYRGFAFTSGIEDDVKDLACSPFNMIELRNIYTNVFYRYDAKMYGVCNLFLYQNAGSIVVNEIIHKNFLLIGNTDDALIKLTDADYSYLQGKFNSSSAIMDIDIYGGCQLRNLDFDITIKGFSASLNTKTAYFPIAYNMDINLKKSSGQESASFDSTIQKIKLMPGSKLTIDDGCNLIGSELTVYSSLLYNNNGTRSGINNFSAGPGYAQKDGAIFLLEGNAKVQMNSIAGAIYCDNAQNITYTSNTIATNEPWNQRQDGIRFYTNYYLSIREILNIYPTYYLNRKKIFVGFNTFYSPTNEATPYIPSINLNYESTKTSIDEYQRVIHVDNVSNVSAELVKNISQGKKSKKNSSTSFSFSNYLYDEVVTHSNNLILTFINSGVSISNNVNGVNEFLPQNITIYSVTPQVDGRDPLYIDYNINLQAKIYDESKIYDKTITWSSSDDSIATVNNSGIVTGISLGLVTIYATCGNLVASYDTEVIEEKEIIPVTSATISEGSNNSNTVAGSKTNIITSGDDKTLDLPTGTARSYFPSDGETFNYNGEYKANNDTSTFSLSYLPSDASISTIQWVYYGTSYNYMLDYSGNKITNGTYLVDNGTLSTTLKWDGYTNLDPDGGLLRCVLTTLDSATFTVDFFVLHNSGINICIIEGTLVTLANGEKKKVEDLTFDDDLLVFDHFSGKFVKEKMFFNYHADEYNIVTAPILTLYFDDNSNIGVHVDHGFFDKTLNKYVYINKNNYQQFIGHKFVKVENEIIGEITLVKGIIEIKTVRVYSPVSMHHLNVVCNNLLSITGEIEGWFNFFDYNQNMQYINVDEDIKKYGLYDYNEFKDYISETIYNIIPIKYLKISVGKGYTTKEDILNVMRKYLSDK